MDANHVLDTLSVDTAEGGRAPWSGCAPSNRPRAAGLHARTDRRIPGTILGLAFAAWGVQPVMAQEPAGYYDGVDARTQTDMRSTLHDAIDDHTRFPYTSSATDTWDILDAAEEDPNNAGNILDLYKNASYQKAGGGNSNYNREHSWPKSYGFPNDSSTNYPYTDCHHLFLADSGYNSSRSNKPYRFCSASCTEKVTDSNNGQGGGSGTYPGNSNWTSGSGSTGTWETWIGRRGDVARAQFYMDIRYEGGTHGVTGAPEPDLILTDNTSLIVADAQQNKSTAYMGLLSDLLVWHAEDPVDAFEQDRHEVVYANQGNRNPFIDHPEWADCLFKGNCAVPWINEFHYDNSGADTGEFVEIAGYAGTSLTGWKVLGYNGSDGTVYKTVNLSGTISDQGNCAGAVSFTFSAMQNGPDGLALVDPSGNVVQFISYEGSFTATAGEASGMVSVDIGVSESSSTSVGYSLRLTGSGDAEGHFDWQAPAASTGGAANTGQTLVGYCGTGGGGGGGGAAADPWINELHYDNDGADTGEFVEIAGEAGADLSNYQIVAYNGNNGQQYKTVSLSGTIPNQQNGYGTLAFLISSLQNGAPDGIALVETGGTVVQFLSYEGSFTAADGPANGMTSTDIGVSESSTTTVGHSLQLSGTGNVYADFAWQSPASNTQGSKNTGQTFQ